MNSIPKHKRSGMGLIYRRRACGARPLVLRPRRDYGVVRDYEAPRNPHVDSILWHSEYLRVNDCGEMKPEDLAGHLDGALRKIRARWT
jgi:hypothetical protein